jgi:1-acyl-sn-glycerol-3-phosphate acyltransferase
MDRSQNHCLTRSTKWLADLVVTLLLWGYYTVGFLVFFSLFYVMAYLFSKNRETSFQRLNHRFYKGFFSLVRVLAPQHKWRIDSDVSGIRSCVIVCNHVSYLDPLLLISLFEKHKTIAKSSLFKLPLFGRMLRLSGYIPSTSEGKLKELMIQHIETMNDYLAAGGNLFIFPEGTRSPDGNIGSLNKGAFKIARLCRTPIKVLFIRNTDVLFRPGRFLFNACVPNTITLELLETIEPDYQSNAFSISRLMEQVHTLLSTQSARH